MKPSTVPRQIGITSGCAWHMMTSSKGFSIVVKSKISIQNFNAKFQFEIVNPKFNSEKSTFPSASLKSHRNFKFSFWNYMSTFLLWTIQNSSRTRARARARGDFCIVHNRKVDISVGLLKGPQKFQIQFLELHGGFSIVVNTELLTRARVWGLLYCLQ